MSSTPPARSWQHTEFSSAATESPRSSAPKCPPRGRECFSTWSTSTLTIALDILVTVVVAFWLLKDGEQLRAGIVSLVPGRARAEADFFFDSFAVVVGGYVRGQLVTALIVGTTAGFGCFVIGVPFPVVVAIAAASFELIPLVGAFIGGGVAILLALTKDPPTALYALLLFIGIHIVEGCLLAPRIQARFVRLHPLVTLLALFAGTRWADSSGHSWRCPWPA